MIADILPVPKIVQDAAYYRDYRARNKKRIKRCESQRRKRERNRDWVVQTTTGVHDVGWKLLSDFDVDVAMRSFWGKRGMRVPTATMGGILFGADDIEDELCIQSSRKTGNRTHSSDGYGSSIHAA